MLIQQAGMPHHRYSRGELIADAAVHALGAAFGLAACGALAATTLPRAAADPLRALAVLVYAAGLLAMLGCSALYNLAPAGAPRKSSMKPWCAASPDACWARHPATCASPAACSASMRAWCACALVSIQLMLA